MESALIVSFAVVSQPTVHFVSHSFPALRSDPTHSAFVARHIVGVCQTVVLRETSRSSGLEFVQRCVLLTFSCCQSQSMFSTSCQPQSMFVTVAAGPLTQVSRAMSIASFERASTMRHPALSYIHAFPFELSVLFPYRRDFQFPLLSRWLALVVPPPIAPTRLGYGDVLLVTPHALRQSPSTLSRPLAHVVSPPSPCLPP